MPTLRLHRRRWLQTAGAGAAATLGLPACTPRRDGVLRFWAMGREGEVAGDAWAGGLRGRQAQVAHLAGVRYGR